MLRIASDRQIAWILVTALALHGVIGGTAAAQAGPDESRPVDIVSSEIELSREKAELRIELRGGRTLDLAIRDGFAWVGGREAGPAPRGEELDRSWRALLNRAMEAQTVELASLLVDWQAPAGAAGEELDRSLESLLSGTAQGTTAEQDRAADEDTWSSDTVIRLNERIVELEKRLRERAERQEVVVVPSSRPDRHGAWYSPLRHLGRGFAGLLSTLAVYAVLIGIGFAVVFFGRSYLEGVADTARHETVRSGLVGLAASFLLLPGFILGAIALAVSIVGIPLLLAWVPLFPVAVVLAALFGYLAVAHAAGEALAEHRLSGGEWFERANSYYYLMTGVGLLLALFLAGHVVEMAGPWLGFIRGLLVFLGSVLTWAAFTIGFGAVLLSRAGTRPRTPTPSTSPDVDVDEILEEGSHV